MRKTKQLSKELGVSRKTLEECGVYDLVLGMDTKLFVDPKLLISSEIEEFKEVNETVYAYFRKLLKFHQSSAKIPRLRQAARNMLTIPEPSGTSIGYGNKSDRGTTSISNAVANSILHSASEILAVGINDEELLEVLGLFVNGYGPDSISDLMIHIAYEHFCKFTQRISTELELTTKVFEINGVVYKLPEHPFADSHIIFIPHSFLRELPLATSWSGVVQAASHNEELRKSLNSITRENFERIFEDLRGEREEEQDLAKKRFEELLKIYTAIIAKPYELASDHSGYYSLMPFVERNIKDLDTKQNPINGKDLINFVRAVITQYKRLIEDNGGNKLLYRKSRTGVPNQEEPHKEDFGDPDQEKPHREDVAQLLFYLVADVCCSIANVALAGESDAGRGPVDFSLATGYDSKVLVEIKKTTNQNLISGYKKQVVAYQKSESAVYCYYVVVDVKKYRNKSTKSDLDKLIEIVKNEPFEGVELIIVDAILKPSPSKL